MSTFHYSPSEQNIISLCTPINHYDSLNYSRYLKRWPHFISLITAWIPVCPFCHWKETALFGILSHTFSYFSLKYIHLTFYIIFLYLLYLWRPHIIKPSISRIQSLLNSSSNYVLVNHNLIFIVYFFFLKFTIIQCAWELW